MKRSYKKFKRSLIKKAFFVANLAIVAGVGFIIWSGQNQSVGGTSSNAVNNNESVLIDDVSSSEIAATIAETTRLPEFEMVRYQADIERVRAATPVEADSAPIKPQIITTGVKSKEDIVSYTVAEGEKIADIANKYNVTSEAIRWSNNIQTWEDVVPGNQIQIPPQNGIVYKVKDGDTPEALAEKFKASKEQIIAFNDAEISGLPVNEYILIPDGQKPPEVNFGYNYSFSYNSPAVFGGNGYTPGQCTYWAAARRAEMGMTIPSNWGSAFTWDDYAASQGYLVDRNPTVGAIMQSDGLGDGPAFWIYHVAVVEEVTAEGIYISDMNYSGAWSLRTRAFYPMSEAVRYKYIH